MVPAETMERMREVHSQRQIIWGVSPGPGCVVAGLAIYVQPAQAVEVAGWYVALSSAVSQSCAGVRKTGARRAAVGWESDEQQDRWRKPKPDKDSQLKVKTNKKLQTNPAQV